MLTPVFCLVVWLIQDSKQLSPEEREKAYNLLISTPGLSYAVETRTNRQIDEMNILQVKGRSVTCTGRAVLF